MLRKLSDGLLAGFMVSFGSAIFLACDVKYVGAFLFCIALVVICNEGYNLFTGKVGYMVENHKKEDFSVLLIGLFGNAVVTCLAGMAIAYAVPEIGEKALVLCTAAFGKASRDVLIESAARNVRYTLDRYLFKESEHRLDIDLRRLEKCLKKRSAAERLLRNLHFGALNVKRASDKRESV